MADYITLAEAKAQVSIDVGLTLYDDRIAKLLGASIDWAENFTQRSLGMLMEPSSPTDSSAVPLPDPVDSPNPQARFIEPGDDSWLGWSGQINSPTSSPAAPNPNSVDYSHALRRDAKAAILMHFETLFDRNTDNFKLLTDRAEELLFPYRVGMGV